MTKRPNAKGRSYAPRGFAGIPRAVMETNDFQQLSYKSQALLIQLAYQYRGSNNGDLTVAFFVLKKRGWKREATISKAVKELLDAKLILKARDGRFLNPGARCALYALIWQPIDECIGKELEISPSRTAPRKFSFEGKAIKMPVTQRVNGGDS
tara:strand:+ start:89511 stop:89969 length:459 start_codon:yes stop_codon:yes gene_type:complete